MKRLINFLCLTFFVTVTIGTSVKKCPDINLPASVDLNGCEAGPCILRHGEEATVKVEFISPIDTQSLQPRVIATLFEQKIPIDLTDELNNACNSLITGNCPIQSGATYVYQLVNPVDSELPLLTFNVELTLFGDNNEPIFCFTLDVKISE